MFDKHIFDFACLLLVCRIQLTAAQYSLSLCDDGDSLWISATSAGYTVPSLAELFGFGSGDYAKDSEGADVMSDTSDTGRWLLYKFTDASENVILEKQRKTPEHLESASFWKQALLSVFLMMPTIFDLLSLFLHSVIRQVMPLNDLLKSLENHGEVNLKLAEHDLSKNDAGNFSVEPVGGVCYVLDSKNPRKKKAKVGETYCEYYSVAVADVFVVVTVSGCMLLLSMFLLLLFLSIQRLVRIVHELFPTVS